MSQHPSAARIILALSGIAAGLVLLGLAFAWATDPRPVEGSAACQRELARPLVEWELERDGPMGCKVAIWSRK